MNLTCKFAALALMGTVATVTAAPQADIKANNSDAAIAVARGAPVSLKIALTPDTLGNTALDWWVVRYDGTDLSSWALNGTWTSGLKPAYQGAGMLLPLTEFYSSSGLPVGSYTFYFAIDSPANGLLDPSSLVYDSVPVHVYTTKTDVADGSPYVDIYDPAKACNGVTLLADLHDLTSPRVIEVDMLGRVTWEYVLPNSLRGAVPVGLDAEPLSNGNVLITLSGKGVYEISRAGSIVWSLNDPKVSHDADRLANGNTLVVFGNNDTANDAQVKEVDAAGKTVWSWSAKSVYYIEPYKNISDQGWTHTNAATRLANGNTLVSLRNFDITAEISPAGTLVWSFDWGSLGVTGVDPHEPEIQPNDNLLVCLATANSPYQAVEIRRSSGEVVWQYSQPGRLLRGTRDCNRLANGNTLILSVLTQGTNSVDDDESVIFEVTPAGEIVWQFRLKNAPIGSSPGAFYKAHRTC